MKRLLIAAVVVLAVAASSCTPWRQSAAARVDGVNISAKDLENDVRALLKQPQFADAYLNTSVSTSGAGTSADRLPTSVLSVMLNRRVSEVMVQRELAARGIQLTDADQKQAEQSVNDSLQRQQSGTASSQAANLVGAFGQLPAYLRTRLITAEAASSRLRAALATKELGAFAPDSSAWYQSHLALFQQYCLNVIPVKDEAEAKAVIPQVTSATLKDVVAAHKGQDAGCGLGYQVQQSLPANLASAVQNAEAGQAVGPFTANDGSNVLVAVSSRQQQAYNDVKTAADSLYQQDRTTVEDAPWQAWLSAQKPRVSIDPRFGSWDPQKLLVVAPKPATGVAPATSAPATTPGSSQ
jgi:hypothetical protein